MLGLPLLFASCANTEDLYDPAKADALLKAEYSANFIAKFGEIAPDYSWDATSIYPQYQSTRAVTDVNYKPVVGDYYEVEENTLNWLDNKLKEKNDNRKLGKPFMMTVPGNEFTIVPIYQGQAGLSWDLHMVVGNEDTKIWSKSQGIQTGKWVTGKKGNSGYWEWTTLNGGSTQGAEKVRSLQYTFDLTGLRGETMYFYLEITKGYSDHNNKYPEVGAKQSSPDGMMLALNCDRPTNISDENEVMIIGCEDNNIESSTDWDLNDIVFLIYGNPDVPKPVEIINGEIKETDIKRYMIEDLGSSDDFDFNDVVVDVTQERTKKITTVNGVITNEEYVGEPTQKATICHLGGVLPFTLTIGNTSLGEMEGQMNVDPDTEYEITGWDPAKNNISVTVRDKEGGIHETVFPKNGEVPMIIAVDPSVQWMQERVSITKDWFESAKK